MAYINGFPIWVSAGWGLASGAGLLGSVLLLMRSRHAVAAFGLSMVGAVVGLGYQLLSPSNAAGDERGRDDQVDALCHHRRRGRLFLYTRARRAKQGVLR